MWLQADVATDMWTACCICSFVTCFVGVVVVIIWSDDMWSADVASALAAASSASATLAKATALRTTHTAVAAGIRMFILDFIERTFLGCGRGAGIGAGPSPDFSRLEVHRGREFSSETIFFDQVSPIPRSASMQTDCIPDLFGFGVVEGRPVVAAFDGGGSITSDAG